MQYWADLQSVHGLRCYDNIARTRNVTECLYSLYNWFIHLSVFISDIHTGQQRKTTHGAARHRIGYECNFTKKSYGRILVKLREENVECGPMPNVTAALPNIGGALCSMPQSLADAHY